MSGDETMRKNIRSKELEEKLRNEKRSKKRMGTTKRLSREKQ